MKQFTLNIQNQGRGYYLITEQIEQALQDNINGMDTGLLHIFLKHTSASLSINENADPTVREDFKNFEEKLVPRNFPYLHNYEGDDDMPAHIKSSLFGCSLSIPISNGRLGASPGNMARNLPLRTPRPTPHTAVSDNFAVLGQYFMRSV